MLFPIGIENGDENRAIAWALGHPGCFAYGLIPQQALDSAPDAIREYDRWIQAHNQGVSWLSLEGMEICLEETWQVYNIDENFEPDERGYAVNAWFRHDWKPLTAEDVERGLKVLTWGRADLEETTLGLGPDVLEKRYSNERWSITGILKHIGGAEWWYLDRLGLAFPRENVPEEAWERLKLVREYLVDALTGLEGVRRVIGTDGEFWSPRKILRRAVWHERDHIAHIAKLLALDKS